MSDQTFCVIILDLFPRKEGKKRKKKTDKYTSITFVLEGSLRLRIGIFTRRFGSNE